mmetsp:Transcript_35583/g.113757  ORF Transcript_35583/g.113757 Transcript_35583/m.113757 type:complete len:417 (-) Transcript_35583:54-1304(-)
MFSPRTVAVVAVAAAASAGLLASLFNEEGALPSWPVYRSSMLVRNVLVRAAEATAPPRVRVLELVQGHVQAEVLYHLVNLGVVDALYDAPSTCDELGETLVFSESGAKIACRYLKFGATRGLVEEFRNGTFALTPTGALLAKKHPNSVRPDVLLEMDRRFVVAERAAGDPANLRSEAPACGFEAAFGLPFFEWLRTEPDFEATFDDAMTKKTMSIFAPAILGDYPLKDPNGTLCDLAGGAGHLLATFLDAYAHLTGILLEMPEQIKAAQKTDSPLKPHFDRTAFSIVDVFQPLPPAIMKACDVIAMKNLVHSLSDDQAVQVLSNVFASAKARAKVAVMGGVLGTDSLLLEREKHVHDVYMLSVQAGARERHYDEVVALLQTAAGRHNTLRISKPVLRRTRSALSIVETTILQEADT